MTPETRTMHLCGFCHSENYELLTAMPTTTHCWRCGAQFVVQIGHIVGYAPELLWQAQDAAYEVQRLEGERRTP